MQRVSIGIVLIPLAQDLSWDRAHQGRFMSAFFIGYATLQLVGAPARFCAAHTVRCPAWGVGRAEHRWQDSAGMGCGRMECVHCTDTLGRSGGQWGRGE